MKKHKKLSAKILSFALATAMVITAMPGTTFAQEMNGLPECHPVHDESCGYIAPMDGTPYSHLNEEGIYSCTPTDADETYTCPHDDECGYAEAVEGAPCTHSCKQCEIADSSEVKEEQPACSCTVKCAPADEESGVEATINTDCSICGIPDTDLGKCMGEGISMFANQNTIVKRERCLDLRTPPVDKDGNTITSADGVFDMLASEGWKWDNDSLTLTLNGADIEVTGDQFALALPAEATIVVEGSNFLASKERNTLRAYGDLEIGGTGSLTVVSKFSGILVADQCDLTITGGTINVTSEGTGDNTSAIWVNGNINILGGSITAQSDCPAIWAMNNMLIDNAEVKGVSSNQNGIGASGTLTIRNGSTIEAEGNYPPLYSTGDMLIDASTVTATTTTSNAIYTDAALTISGDADVTANGYYCGLNAQGTGITIRGGIVKATSMDDSAVFTKGALAINGDANVTATAGAYCALQANGDISLGDSTIEAISPNDSAIFTPTVLLINGNADVAATGKLRGLQSLDVQIAGSAKVNAISEEDSAITGKDNLSITGNAEVTATGAQAGIASNGPMTLSAKDITVTGDWYGINNEGDASGITIGGKLTAEATTTGYGIYSAKNITADDNADITVTGTWAGIHAGSGDITFAGSKVEATGTSGDGIYSAGTITIGGGNVHAKGADGYVAIRAKNVQTASEAATSKIKVTNMLEKNGGKVAFCDWYSYDHTGEIVSWTSFIAKDDTELISNGTGGMNNGLQEVWLTDPTTVTFDNEGTTEDVMVYPGNTVSKPEIDPTKTGCHFSGWYLDDTKFDFTTPITGNITLKAKLDAHMPNKDDGDCTTAVLCSVCAYETTAAKAHVLSDWQSDADNHWKKCTNDNCTYTEQSTAQTGDNSSIQLFVLMMGASGIALVVLGKKKKIFKYLKK